MFSLQGRAFALRRLLPVSAVVVGALALAGTAGANTLLRSGSSTVGDCTLTAQLQDAFPYSSDAYGDAWLTCGRRHAYSQVQVILKRDDTDGSIHQTASPLVTYTNSFGLGNTALRLHREPARMVLSWRPLPGDAGQLPAESSQFEGWGWPAPASAGLLNQRRPPSFLGLSQSGGSRKALG